MGELLTNRNDLGGYLARGETGETVLCFGRHRGKPLALVAEHAPAYLRIMLDARRAFPPEVRRLVRRALAARGEATSRKVSYMIH